MPYTDASTVLLKKLATYLADDENSGAADIIRGWTPPSSARPSRRIEVGGRITLTPEVIWFNAHPLNYARSDFGIPVEEITRLDDVSSGLRKKVRITLRGGIEPTFLMWGIPRFIEAVDRARGAL
ncbi:hypothetical protein Q7F20_01920 [Curtobacterium sp. A7_M15]|uniref:hypothetical protein n=1 Tax=Curtobacterium sp. A7_M15 TaxID=3065241 RepID=UPI002737F6C1|nr:hypothetical protein [Curtobacterium sp. A7_M15]MDP4332114.1 hypothetical protein [Curtobacterium sp. A7_M15]